MAININIPIEDAVTDGSLNPVTSNAVFDALATKANTADLATVATTGDYNDLDNLPTIPSAQVNADWNATSGVAEILNKPTISSGTVTSVGLTMPSAFTVANSPITSSGDIAVTGAGVASQYVRGDGSLANFPTTSGGGASVSYYLNGSVSQGTFGGVAMREINKVPILGAGTDFTINTNGYIQSFITDANDPNQLEIPVGNWNFETYFSASSNGGNPSFYVELYKWDGATLSLIASNSTNPEIITGGTAIDLYLTALAVPQTTLALTDRLVVRIYVTPSGRTIKLHTEDNHLSQIITTFSTGLTSLNGITAQVQNLAVGTSGTDFVINSSGPTHTFNLPTASAANRGALSSADWTTFNGKQPTLVSATNIKTINGTTLLGSGDLVVGSSSGVFGISNASGVYTYYATFTLAMAAATSGQTIVMFANFTETGAVEITLKDGVNINGNGYTYTLNNSGSSNAFKVTNSTSINCSIINLNVIRIGSTSIQLLNSCLYSGNSTSGNIYLTGSKFTNLGSGSGIAIGSASTISIYDGTAIANTFYGSIYIESSAGAKVYNSTGISTSQAGINCYIGGDLFNCTGISSSGIGIDGAGATTAGNQYNCIGISSTNYGLTTGSISINCIGRSTTNNGIYSISSKLYNCIGISVSGRGIQNVGTLMSNCQGISSSNVGILLQTSTSLAYNCFSRSDSSYSVWGWNGSKIYNSIIECNWNNSGGNGIQGISGFITNTIVNCVFRLANVSAPYLFNGGTAQAISMRGNTYQGGGAFNINLTQAIVAVQDAQGNIFL